jgi:SAV_6107-like HEPN
MTTAITAAMTTTATSADAAPSAATIPSARKPTTVRPAGAAPPSRAGLALLRQASDGLAEAHRVEDPLLRYPAAYLAALRAGAAVLAVRARPEPRRGATRNVWQLLAQVAPEFAEWALFFASCSDTRAAAEAGIARLVGRREADDLLRQAEQFVGLVRAAIPVR